VYAYIHIHLGALITDIKTDIEVAKHSLKRKVYAEAKEHPLFYKIKSALD
jgi:riboflavin kinase